MHSQDSSSAILNLLPQSRSADPHVNFWSSRKHYPVGLRNYRQGVTDPGSLQPRV